MASWVGPAIVAAIISALVTAAGWYVAHEQDAGRERQRRRERTGDIQTAILAEIGASLHQLEAIDLNAHVSGMSARLEADGGAFTPFVPREVPTFVINALMPDIHLLPTRAIDHVIVYYRQLLAVAQLVDDLRSDRYERLDAPRKIAIYRDYVELLVHARTLGREAAEALSASLSHRALSSQASDPSDH